MVQQKEVIFMNKNNIQVEKKTGKHFQPLKCISRSVLIVLLLLSACGGMWGENWTWYGNFDTDWDNQNNWVILGIGANGIPTKNDDVDVGTAINNMDINKGVTPTIKNIVLSKKTLTIKTGGSLTVLGNFTNDSKLIIESGGSLNVNGNFINNGTIDNQGNITITGNLQDDTAKKGTRSITTTTTIIAKSVNLTKPVNLSGTISTTSTQSYGDAVKLSGATTLLTPSDITFSKTVDSADTTTNSLTMGSSTQKAGTVTFNGSVGSTDPLSKLDVNATSIKFNGGTSAPVITTTGDQIYNGEVATGSVIIINPKAPGNVVFKEPVNFSTIADKSGCTSNITFEKGGTISSATTFNTSGIVTLNTAPATTPVDKKNMTTFSTETNLFTHTAGTTVMNGIVSVGAIKLSSTSYDITIPANTILNFTTDFTNKGTLNNKGTLSLEKNYTNNGTYEGTGTVELCGTGTQTFTSKDTETYTSINVSNPTGIVTFNSSSASGKINMDNFSLNCPVVFTKDAVINKDLTITANSTNAKITTTGTASGSASFEVLNFTNEEGAKFNFAGVLAVKGNFIDKGTITGLTELKLIGNGTTGTGQQEITPGLLTTYEKINILNTSGPILFKESLKAKNIVDNANAVNITFEKGGVISSDTIFNTTGTVTFGGAASTIASSPSKITMSFADQATPTVPAFTFTHTAGPTTIAANANVILIATSIDIGTNTLTIPETSTLEIPEDFTNKITIKNDGTLIFKKNFINDTAGKITNNKLIQIHGDYTNNGTYIGTTDNKDIIELCGTAAQTFTAKANETYNNISITNKTGSVEFTTKLAINNLSLSCPVSFTNGVTINNDLTIKSGQPVTITSGSAIIEAFTVNNFIIEKGGNLNFGGTLSVQNFKNEGTLTLTKQTVIKVKGDFTDNGTITSINILEIHLTGSPDSSAIKANTQTFKPNVNITYNKLLIDNSTNIPVIFNDKLNVKTIGDKIDYKGDITFEKGGIISSDTTFYTKGIVTFGSGRKSKTNIGTAAPYKSLTHTTGKTVIKGNMNVGDVTLGETELTGTITANNVTLGSDGTTSKTSLPISLSGKITSTEAQAYKGPVTLAGNTELEASDKEISFNSTIDGANSLTIGKTNKSSKVTFSGKVGAITKLTSLDVTAVNIQLPSNVSATTQTYTPTTGYLILSASGTELSGKDITLYDNIDGKDSTLSIYSSSIYSSGTFTLKDTEKSPDTTTKVINLANFRELGRFSKVILSGDITASKEISFSSPVTLADDVALIGETVSFGSKSIITGSHNLILGDSTTPSTTKTITIGADINNITSLKTYGQNINLTGNIGTSGTQLYETDKIILSKDTTLTGTAIDLYDTIEGSSYTLTIINSGILNFKDKASTLPDTTSTVAKVASFTQNGSGTVNLAGDITATGNKADSGISFASAITLTDNVALIGKNITLSETVVDDNIGNKKSLTLGDSPTPSSTESITISGAIGPILSLEANASANIALNGNVTTTEHQAYNGPVVISGDRLLKTTKDISFTSTINGNGSLTLGEGNPKANKVSFKEDIGTSVTPTQLTVNANTIDFPSQIKTNGSQLYNGDVNLVKATTLNANTGNITFNNPITGNKDLTINKAAEIFFEPSIKYVNIAALNITATTTNLPVSLTTTGKQTYNSDITLHTEGTKLESTSGDIFFAKNITGNITGTVAGGGNKVFEVKVPTTNIITLPESVTTTASNQVYTGIINLSTNSTTLNTTGEIIFNNKIDSNASLIIGSPDKVKVSKVTFKDNIGTEVAPLSSLSINAGEINLPAKIFTNGEQTYTPNNTIINSSGTTFDSTNNTNIQGKVNATGNLIFKSPVVLLDNLTITNTSSPVTDFDVSFGSTIKSNPASKNLTIEKLNNITFEGNIGDTPAPLGNIDVSTTKTSVTLPLGITTSGTIKIVDSTTTSVPSIKLKDNGDTVITGKDIHISDNISSPTASTASLDINNSGILYLYESSTMPDTAGKAIVNNFTQSGSGSVTLAGDISAKGDISFAKAITLTDNVALIGKNITLLETVKDNNNGDKSLILGDSPAPSLTENITITKDIGTILSLDANAKTNIALNGNVTTIKSQNYNGPVTLSSSKPITTTTTSDVTGEGNIHFYNTTGSNTSDLIINTKPNQNITFDKAITLKSLLDTNNKGNIIISGGGSTETDLTFNTPGEVTIKGPFTTKKLVHNEGPTVITDDLNAESVNLGKETIGTVSLSGTISTIGTQEYKGPVTIAGTSNMKVTPATGTSPIITFEKTSYIDLKANNLTITSNTIFNGSNISGTGNISATEYDFLIQSVTGNITEITADVTSKNIIFDISKQPLTIGCNFTAKDGDIAIFGSHYSTIDQESGVENIYTYNYTTSPVFTTFPQINKTPNPSAANLLTIKGDSKLQTNKNLYINGIKVKSNTGKLIFDFPSNYNNLSTYATAFYSDFSEAECSVNNLNRRKIVIESCKLNEATQNYNTGWDFQPFAINKAYTVDDNVICIEFNRPVRFLNDSSKGGRNGINQADSNKIRYSNGAYNKTFFTKNTDGTYSPINTGNDNISVIYLTSPETWNTDATGTNPGEGTNKEGKHITNIIPSIEIKRNSDNSSDKYNYFITDIYGKRLTHYSNNSSTGTKVYTENTKPSPDKEAPSYDQCPPVLIAVSNGQELHEINPLKWQSYDAHNFMEFRYSEKVLFGDNTTLNPDFSQPDFNFDNAQNITPEEGGFGQLSNLSSGFTLKGIGHVSNGKILTGTKDNPKDLSINTFYRKDPYSIRLSIAGKTTDTPEGKTWDGYIDYGTVMPSGTVSNTEKDTIVKDLSGNRLTSKNDKLLSKDILTSKNISLINITIPLDIPNGCATDNNNFYTFGNWDLSNPSFAPVNIPEEDVIKWGKDYNNQYEILGVASAGTKLQRLEFHIFDNTPDYASSELVWYSSKGWYSNNQKKASCADIYGGARPFETEGKRTTGGIRYHTINEKAFSYKVGNNKHKDFISVLPNVASSFFLGLSSTEKLNPAGELYFALELGDKNYPIETTFDISYMPTPETGYVTDLAGNKLKTINKNNPIASIDRTPPAFNILLSPINQKEIFIVFSKKIETDINKIHFRDENKKPIELKSSSSFGDAVPYSFRIIEIDENGTVLPQSDKLPRIDTSVKTEFTTVRKKNNSELTTIKLTLDRPLTYKDLTSYYIQLAPSPAADGSYINTSFDSITGISDARVTIIRDKIGNFMQMYSASPISDFAINFIEPIYGHNPEIKNNGTSFGYGLYEDGSWAVHDWSAGQQNYGTLYANESVEIAAKINNNDKTGLPKGAVMYLDNTPDEDSISTQINEDLNKDLRLWLPKLNPDYIIPSISQKNNSDYDTIAANYPGNKKEKDYSRLFFNINKDLAKEIGPDQQISFLFALSEEEISNIGDFKPIMIYSKLFVDTPNKYDLSKSPQIPLYCLRLSDNTDITSIDLWSYKTKSITKQRGGVTILNNVINAPNGEDTVIQVSVPKSGNLSVMVMTIDGNIIKYLHRGRISPGEYNYYWDGKNNNGSIVARGLYFVRIIGAGIDETRKVMVVH